MADPTSINELHADLFADDGEEDRFRSPQEARKKAMDYLARREYGQRELKRKLTGAGFHRDAVERAVDQLSADGLQDDRRFVDGFVQAHAGRGKGPLRVQAELGQRGLDAGLVNEALETAGIDWFALAREVREKKFGAGLPNDFRDKARQMRFLQYRGFGADHVHAAVGSDDD